MSTIIKNSIFLLALLLSQNCFSQTIEQRYQKAEQLLPRNLKNKIFTNWVSPISIKGTNMFLYSVKTNKGTEYKIIDYKKKQKKEAFNQQKLAKNLSKLTQNIVNPYNLGIYDLNFSKNLKLLTFKKLSKKYQCVLTSYKITEIKTPKFKQTEIISPDSTKIAFIKEYNIWIKELNTGDTVQLTYDGSLLYPYGGDISWYFKRNINKNEEIKFEINAQWSKDSKKLWIARYDRRNSKELYLMQTSPDSTWRSQIYAYYRPLAGDSLITTIEYYIADIKSKKVIKADIKPIPVFTNYGSKWSEDSKSIFKYYYARGWKTVYFTQTNAKTGETRIVYTERSKTYVDPMMINYKLLNNDKQLLWLSEKDGWNHIYRIDVPSGKIINQVTKGNFVVRDIIYVDEKEQKIYFTANGKEKGDVYYKYLYATDFSGKNTKLLTPEYAYHTPTFLKNNKYFIDNFSRVDMPNKSVLRRTKDGKIIMTVESTDTHSLDSTGIKYPETFKAKARDGKTDIYGVIYRPVDFDSTKMYPVIDYSYSGPQTIVTPKTFSRGILNMNQAIAELGFIVVSVDGLGSAFRSKKFHDVSYKNLGDIGGADHITAIKQLADKYPYMDTTRVGIYGHSAGGYDAARALIAYNYFYKVAVSGAGNHDHRIAKAWWPELYMGYPAGKNYDKQSNILNASKLKGKLLLMHGSLDNNVNPAGSMRFADELIKANKDFELYIIPDVDHSGLWWNNYYIRKRWDFFVKNLRNENPPFEYKIKN